VAKRKPPAPDLFASAADKESHAKLTAAGWRAVVGRDGRTPTGFWTRSGVVKSREEALRILDEENSHASGRPGNP
jgi:hypothetical protein